MSKMGELYRELSEQAYDLGFISLEDAENHGWRVNYEMAKLEPPVVQPSLDEMKEQEKAHKAWLKEQDEVIEGLERLIALEKLLSKAYGDEFGASESNIKDLQRAIDFIRKGEC